MHTLSYTIATPLALYLIIMFTGTDEQLFQSVRLSLQADWASLSRAFPLLVGCACPHLIYMHRVYKHVL